jgi:hypothetical protein
MTFMTITENSLQTAAFTNFFVGIFLTTGSDFCADWHLDQKTSSVRAFSCAADTRQRVYVLKFQ